MNTLGRDIAQNEVVVIKKKVLKPEYQDAEQRLFCVTGGFGMRTNTVGSALHGFFVCDNEECRMDGSDIDKEETEAFKIK